MAAQNIDDLATRVLELKPSLVGVDRELVETVGDIEALALLGRYYAHKIRGATYKAAGDRPSAITSLQKASLAWRTYAARVATLYQPQLLSRLIGATNYQPLDVSKLQADVDQEVTSLGGTVPAPERGRGAVTQ